MLSAMGHYAISVQDAHAALAILAPNPVDILLTDVGFPICPARVSPSIWKIPTQDVTGSAVYQKFTVVV